MHQSKAQTRWRKRPQLRSFVYAERWERSGRIDHHENQAMTPPANQPQSHLLDRPHAFDVTEAQARLCAADGGYELVHESTRLEICVYTLIAPEPDYQRINKGDELYIVLEGRGALDVGGEQLELREGRAAFVPAGANHCFSAYEHLTVLAILGRQSAR